MSQVIQKIGVVGAGAWGTALAATARRAGRDVLIQAHESDVADAINQSHENTRFLPGVPLDKDIRATTQLEEITACDAVLLVPPAQFLRPITLQMASSWREGVPAVICAKGIEQKTGSLLSEIVAETLPNVSIAVLSGPTFAIEVAKGLPTAVTLACKNAQMAASLSKAIGTPTFRAYRSDDIIGAELGGAIKNVLAIGCGIIEGRKLGDNARAAFITRGLAEIARLAAAKGADPETLVGLSGLGDLTLTCNAIQSRNFSLGVAMGEGRPLEDILAERAAVTEGVFTASSAVQLAKSLNVEAPICTAMDGILNNRADIDATIQSLLARPVGDETPLG
ncbi:MAG: NAD(P)-dependent glycerol-3-phosphate dehydrogenase [Rhodospirillaceae bacterium]|nr:NAD(P)-dependent glycerol-3-phosphate dehydrogenase [Rhodospirillaceae bacterium]